MQLAKDLMISIRGIKFEAYNYFTFLAEFISKKQLKKIYNQKNLLTN